MWPQPATIAGWGSGDAGIWGTRGKHIMAVTRTALKRETHPKREGVTLATFVWQGTDKRGVKMKGEQQSRNANFLRAELRRQGITPTVVKVRSEEHTSELQSLMRISYAVFCLKKKQNP